MIPIIIFLIISSISVLIVAKYLLSFIKNEARESARRPHTNLP